MLILHNNMDPEQDFYFEGYRFTPKVYYVLFFLLFLNCC